MNPTHDLIIIGAGSAGLAADVYAGRAKLRTSIPEESSPGGQAGNTAEVVNYPDVRRASGPELIREMKSHVQDFGVKIETAEIKRVELSGEIRKLYPISGTYQSRVVITVIGASFHHDGFKGGEFYSGHGAVYCATCNGESSNGFDIFVTGGGYTAAEEAIHPARFAKLVTIVIRDKDFSCTGTVVEKVVAHPKITVKYNTLLEEAERDSLPHRACFQDKLTGEASVYDAGENGTFGMFVFVGYDPTTKLFHEQVDMDEDGYILTSDVMHTNMPGVFTAGDPCPKLPRQIVAAVIDDAMAATSAEKYITSEEERLGLPTSEEDVATAKPEPEQKEDKAENPALVSDETYLGSELKEQLVQVFQRLKKGMTIIAVVDPSNQKSLELEDFLREIEPLSNLIHLRVLQKDEDLELEQSLGIERYLLAVFLDKSGRFSGVKFSGILGGHEVNSSVLGTLHLATEDKLTEEQLKKIRQLPPNTTLKVGVTLACPYCPSIVAVAHSIVIVSGGNIMAEMVGVALFLDIWEEHYIMSIPVLIVNSSEWVIFGAQSLDQVLQKATEG